MDKLPGKKSLFFLSLLILTSGCGYHLVNPTSRTKVYIGYLVNDTFQPQLDIYLLNELKEKILNYPGFELVSDLSRADWQITGRIIKFEREPLFFSTENSDKIILARFNIGINLKITNSEYTSEEQTIEENIAVALTPTYQEEEMLKKISQEVADKIFFRFLRIYEKKIN